MHRKLNPKNADKKWLNWLLQGSGSQVNEALEFLKEIDEFVEEEF
jgi:flavoprotein